MSDRPDRTPEPHDSDVSFDASEEPPTGSYPTASRPEEERTEVHRTAPGAPGAAARQDSTVTAFTPSAPGAAAEQPAAAGQESDAAQAPSAPPASAAAPAATPKKVSVRNRGRMRRRLRYLRRVRELGYRDLGGLVFELRRAGTQNEVLVGAKVDALWAIDQELHVLEHGLRDFRAVEELHEPGVSVCLRCGALHGSDANFCPQCGIRVDAGGTGPVNAEPATVAGPATGSHAAAPTDGPGSATGRHRR